MRYFNQGILRYVKLSNLSSMEHELIALVEAETYPQALELVVARRVKMLYAGLKGVRVPGAVLSEGDFRRADLSHADLAGINLYKADLRARQPARNESSSSDSEDC